MRRKLLRGQIPNILIAHFAVVISSMILLIYLLRNDLVLLGLVKRFPLVVLISEVVNVRKCYDVQRCLCLMLSFFIIFYFF